MSESMLYRALADVVLAVHAGVVLFVVGGLAAVFLGNARGWRWVNGMYFRAVHFGAIALVVVQAWLGQACALTTLESWLREQGGATGYSKGFIEHWVQRLIFYEAPLWVFALVYTAFALLVIAAWWRYPPRRCRGR